MEEEDIVLCTVIKIEGTTVFVKIEDSEKEGTIVTSEIAPGRIRNLRDYVVPGKKIVCKVLGIDATGNICLSLRRVSAKEKKEILDKYEKEKSSLSILKSVLKEKANETAEKIKKNSSLFDFLQQCKENPRELEKYVQEEEAKKLCKILSERKEKEKEVKKEFSLISNKPEGLEIIKKILLPYKDFITYITAGKFLLKVKAKDYKKANSEIERILKEIKEKCQKDNCKFSEK